MSTDPRIEAAVKAIEAVVYGKNTGQPVAEECARAALAAIDKAATITTRAQMEALPDGSVFIDLSGDIGTVHTARVWYPETSPISLTYAARYLPARVIHRGAE